MGFEWKGIEIMNAKDVLQQKGSKVILVNPEQSIQEAIDTLVSNGVGALVVVNEKKNIVGMLTERDILRANAKSFDRLNGIKVSDLMSEKVIIGLEHDDLDYVMRLMTERKIRHLPIMSQGKLVGIVSIGDLVKAKVRQAEFEIRYLTDYISGQYP